MGVRRTLVIAECGSCHDGSIERALRLIDAAKDCDADVAKFQFWSSVDRFVARRKADIYRETYQRYQVPAGWLPRLHDRCQAIGIEFMMTIYLPEDVAIVAPYVRRIKMASFEAEDRALADAALAAGKRLIISTGMMIGDDARRIARPEWAGPKACHLLHCVSAYPAPLAELNLAVIREQSYISGWSDHSDPCASWTGALAVAAGAEIVEAHLRLDETDETNPDWPHSMSPDGFKEYVRHIRFAELVLGDGIKRVQLSEVVMLPYRVRDAR